MGTVYCLHHDEEEMLGSDPVPCPFCGFGADQEAKTGQDELEAFGIEDSNDALKHALLSDERDPSHAGRDDGLRGYW